MARRRTLDFEAMHDIALEELPRDLQFPESSADDLLVTAEAKAERSRRRLEWCQKRGLDPLELIRASYRRRHGTP